MLGLLIQFRNGAHHIIIVQTLEALLVFSLSHSQYYWHAYECCFDTPWAIHKSNVDYCAEGLFHISKDIEIEAKGSLSSCMQKDNLQVFKRHRMWPEVHFNCYKAPGRVRFFLKKRSKKGNVVQLIGDLGNMEKPIACCRTWVRGLNSHWWVSIPNIIENIV